MIPQQNRPPLSRQFGHGHSGPQSLSPPDTQSNPEDHQTKNSPFIDTGIFLLGLNLRSDITPVALLESGQGWSSINSAISSGEKKEAAFVENQ